MKQILMNLAMIDLLNLCKDNQIDSSGTHVIKYPRKFVYQLIKSGTGQAVAKVQFHKNAIPSHFIIKNN